MVAQASSTRTFMVLSSAAATVITALLFHPVRATSKPTAISDDGMLLTARMTSTTILRGATDQNLAVTITAPAGAKHARPPLSLAVVIDRSGSMNGEPMENAKASAARLISRLDAGDAFSIVTYSSADETVTPMLFATDRNKTQALAAIAQIDDDGGTCISCGLIRGARELSSTPVIGGVQRIMLISDGQANEGIYDRDELAKLAADTAAKGTSISTVGVGLDFDEVTMTRLADVGRGNYYFVEDTRHLDAMFAKELGGLAETVAADVRLVLEDGAGTRIEEAYGYPMTRQGDRVLVPVADLRAGETRKVVLRVRVEASAAKSMDVTTVKLGWRRISDGASRKAETFVRVDVSDDLRDVEQTIDVKTVEAVEQVNTARAFEEASAAYDSDGAEAAQQIIDRRVEALRQNKFMPPASTKALEQQSFDAKGDFAAAPSGGAAGAKAKKASRAKAYDLVK